MTLDIDSTVRKLIEGFSFGLTDREACVYAGCSKQWLYDYCKDNPNFTDQKEALKDNPKIKAKRIIDNSLDEKDKDIAKWYLERKAKDEFSTKTDIHQTGTIDNKIEVTFHEGKYTPKD